jgi:CheY-like chemotaxis protein
VIFLDILLPAEVGWDILRDLKADPRTRQIPVIVVSVLDRPEKGLALGADGYLVKPVSRERLLAALSSISTPRAPSQSVLIVSPAPGGKRAPRILLAEDDETNVVTLIDFLRSREYEVFVARNGKEAVRLTREVRPDLILMDIQMPVMDGFRATELIRADASREIAATPIVAVTALAMTGDRERCLAAGANEYLTKPVGLKRLASVIEGLLPTR